MSTETHPTGAVPEVGSVTVPLFDGTAFPFLRAASTLIEDHGMNAIVDCGEARHRQRLEQALAQAGLRPDRVDLLILTHLHFDHCENADAFPRAAVMVHWREIEALERLLQTRPAQLFADLRRQYEVIHPQYLRMIGYRLAAHRDHYRRLLADRGRLSVIEGDVNPTAAIEVVETPGHSPGHVSVLVNRSLWIAGDAVASRQDWRPRNGSVPQLCWNVAEYRRAQDRIARTPGLVIPGHGAAFSTTLGRGAPDGVAA